MPATACRRLASLALILGLLFIASRAVLAAEGPPLPGFHWDNIGLASSGWMRSIAADPRDENVLWAVADMGGGIVRTTNGGRSWEDCTEAAINDTHFGSFSNVFVSPSGAVFVALRGALIRTRDNGKSWQTATIHTDRDPTWIEFVASRPDTMFLSDNYGTVHRSTDGGMTWEALYQPPNTAELTTRYEYRVAGYYTRLVAMPAPTGEGLALYRNHPYYGVTMSLDEGKTWTECNTGLPHKAVLSLGAWTDDKTREVVLYALLEAKMKADGTGWTGGMYVSTDRGQTWVERNKGIFTHVPAQFLAGKLPRFNSLEVSRRTKGLAYIIGR